MTLRPILRRAAIAAVAALVLVMALIQVWQYRFRFRAERLHAEILALQLHPGTFADLQRLQREWGAYGDYRGVCAQEHCIYQIAFTDMWAKKISRPFARFNPEGNLQLLTLYELLGGRPAWVSGHVQVHNNQIWGSSFFLALDKSRGEGRNKGGPYELSVELRSSTRITAGRGSSSPIRALRRGFDVEGLLNCLGCEFAEARMTGLTNQIDIQRFNEIRFGCLTSIVPCSHPADLSPNLWRQSVQDLKEEEKSPREKETDWCSIPIQTLVREVNDVALVEFLSAEPGKDRELGAPPDRGKIQILRPLKNAHSDRDSDEVGIYMYPGAMPTGSPNPGAALIPGNRYYFLYDQPRPGVIPSEIDILSCHALPDTPENAKAIQQGIDLDPSNDEP